MNKAQEILCRYTASDKFLIFCVSHLVGNHPYLFNTTGFYSHGKEKLFAQWGYTVDDASWLRSEMERQAREKYILGDYELGKLNIFGQRINIMIEIPRRDQTGTVSFTSGWMVRPNGELKLSTPYGGK